MKKLKAVITGAMFAFIALVANQASAMGVGESSATLNIDITVNASAAVEIDGLGISSANAITWNPGTRAVASGDVSMNYASSTVLNNGNLTERWYVSTATNAIDSVTGGNGWTVNSSTNVNDVGPNQFAVQAVFASSATTNTAGAVATTNCPQSGYAGYTNQATIWNSTATLVFPVGPITGNAGNAYGANGGAVTYENYVDTVQTAILGAPATPDTGASGGNYAMYSQNIGAGSGTQGGKRALCFRVIMPASTTSSDNQIIPLIITAQQL